MADDLSEFKAWNVKDFPAALRVQITDAAAKQNITVAKWLTVYFLTHGIDGVDLPTIPELDKPVKRNGIDALDHAIDRACQLAEHRNSMPRRVADLAFRLVFDELHALAPPRSPKARLPRLTQDVAE